MPTYEYQCRAGHRFERFSPTMNDQRRMKCPTCGRQVERQISGGAGLVFKGSGFYITDYKRAGEKQEKEKKKEGDAKPAETKPADTKPAKKKDSGAK
jgi:putative FmdB family regulatory protein